MSPQDRPSANTFERERERGAGNRGGEVEQTISIMRRFIIGFCRTVFGRSDGLTCGSSRGTLSYR